MLLLHRFGMAEHFDLVKSHQEKQPIKIMGSARFLKQASEPMLQNSLISCSLWAKKFGPHHAGATLDRLPVSS